MKILNLFLLVFILSAGIAFASSADNISGWAWSDMPNGSDEVINPFAGFVGRGAGWISFNSTNQGTGVNYGVNSDSSGLLSGYAWSEHIGWITFNNFQLSGCPSGTCEARLTRATGVVSGWARACAGTSPGDCSSSTARSDGWDGWIHLRNDSDGDGIVNTDTNADYGVFVTGCNWNGYAWGSEVVGWIHLRGTNYGVLGSAYACAQSSGSDLFSRNLRVATGRLKAGEQVTYTGEIRNRPGQALSSQSTARYCLDSTSDVNCLNGVDGTFLGEFTVPPLVAPTNYTVPNSNPWTIPIGTASHIIYLCVDVYNTNLESNESNNCTFIPPFTISQCANGVDDPDPEDTDFDEGDKGCHSDFNETNPVTYDYADNDESNARCSNNGYDDDGDGYADTTDPGCHTDGNPLNPASYDPLDDDERDIIFREIFLPFTRLFASLLGF